jgi:acetyltransferase-like isoleucine patch superfamily enzyme
MSELTYQLRWALPLWLVGVLTNWWPDNRVALRLRGMLARPFIGKCGHGLQLGRNVTLLNPHRLEVGNDVYVAQGCWLNALGGLALEDEVVLGPYVVISTLQHVFQKGSVRFGGSISGPVRIGRGSWLAAHVSVKCGVTVGKGNLVAANAAVAEDTPDGAVMGGVPARVIGENRDGEPNFYRREDILASAHGGQ